MAERTQRHDQVTNLPEPVIDAVHRITTDAARIAPHWIESLQAQGISDGHYIELLGVVVAAISIDGFHRAMGLPLEPLPEPMPGEPDNYRPPGASMRGAYLPSVAPADLSDAEADLYEGAPSAGNVASAMSLVPDAVRMLFTLSKAHYLGMQDVPDPTANGGRALTRAQIELTAGRVSSLSNCFY